MTAQETEVRAEEAALRDQVRALIASWDSDDPRARLRAEDELVRQAMPEVMEKDLPSDQDRRLLDLQRRVVLDELWREAQGRGDDLDFLIRYERVVKQRTRLWVRHEAMRRVELERLLSAALSAMAINWRSQTPLEVEWPQSQRPHKDFSLFSAHFDECLPALAEAVRGAQAAQALVLLGDLMGLEQRAHLDAALSLVRIGLDNPNAQVRVAALHALERLGTDDELPWVLAAMHDPDRSVRWGAVRVAAGFPDARVVPALIEALDDPALELRFFAALALERVTQRPRSFNAYAALPRRRAAVASWRAWWAEHEESFSFSPQIVPPRKFKRPTAGESSAG